MKKLLSLVAGAIAVAFILYTSAPENKEQTPPAIDSRFYSGETSSSPLSEIEKSDLYREKLLARSNERISSKLESPEVRSQKYWSTIVERMENQYEH